MRKTWISVIIIFLLAANLALLVSLLVRNNNNREVSDKSRKEQNVYRTEKDGLGKFESHIAEKLGMDEKQKELLVSFSSEFHKEKKELAKKMAETKAKYFDNLATVIPDSALLEQLADTLGMLHSRMIKLDHAHYKNIKSICTTEQANRLDSLGRLHMCSKKDDEWSGKGRRQEKPEHNRQHNN